MIDLLVALMLLPDTAGFHARRVEAPDDLSHVAQHFGSTGFQAAYADYKRQVAALYAEYATSDPEHQAAWIGLVRKYAFADAWLELDDDDASELVTWTLYPRQAIAPTQTLTLMQPLLAEGKLHVSGPARKEPARLVYDVKSDAQQGTPACDLDPRGRCYRLELSFGD